jgi:hypothetical protein
VQGVDASRVPLDQIFRPVEQSLKRLQVYLEAGPTTGMADILVDMMVAVLSILALVTNEINQNKASKLISDSGYLIPSHPGLSISRKVLEKSVEKQ